jgi:hypothetical protein
VRTWADIRRSGPPDRRWTVDMRRARVLGSVTGAAPSMTAKSLETRQTASKGVVGSLVRARTSEEGPVNSLVGLRSRERGWG